MGESICTLRQVLRRFNYAYTRQFISPSTVSMYNGYNIHPAMPPHIGYDTSGQYSAKGLITVATDYPYNFVGQHPLNFISSAFIAYRGSVNYATTVNSTSGNPAGMTKIRASRVSNVAATPAYGTQSSLLTNMNTVARYHSQDMAGYISAGGVALAQMVTSNGLTYACPMYSRYKFLSLDKTSPTLTSWAIDDRELFRSDVTSNGQGVISLVQDFYVAIGTDWNCHFFLNVPTFYHMSATPTPT
jgi:hypothetical protein